MQAGLCVGVGNAGIAGGLQALRHGATSTEVPLSIGIVVAGVLYTATHPAFANRGYKTGRVVVTSAHI